MMLAGHTFLLISGHPWEDIDGIRRYANPLQPESLGLHLAEILRAQGAQAIVIFPQPHAHSAAQMLAEAQRRAALQVVDGVLLLASWSSVKAHQPSPTKLKVKSEGGDRVVFAVEGNIDLAAELAVCLPHLPIAGFDYEGNYFTRGSAPWLESISRILELADIPTSVAALRIAAKAGRFPGKRVIITSGPTAEPLNGTGDVLTNFSSGAQGSAIASAMADEGAEVVLVSGLSSVMPPEHEMIRAVNVWTAEEMLVACRNALPADVFIGVAAVADFVPVSPTISLHPGEKGRIALKQNPDILSMIGHLPASERPRVVIGFAAENDASQWLDYARGKLLAKNADAICANYIGEDFLTQNAHNDITLIERSGEVSTACSWGRLSKREVGERLVQFISSRLK